MVLKYLKNQKLARDILWEVIIIDNASTDNTSMVARINWPSDSVVPLYIFYEAKPGLSNARQRGFLEANYDIVSFIDDDNWVSPEWISAVMNIMSSQPEVGVCGGRSEPVYENIPPYWFMDYQGCYAIGAQNEVTGDVTWSRGYLWGAGLTIRKAAWEELTTKGFRSILTDRTGSQLSSGGDSEICMALRLAGWHLWYDSELYLHHFMPSQRLSWQYLRKLNLGFGSSHVLLNTYKIASEIGHSNILIKAFEGKWIFYAIYLVFRLLSRWKYLLYYSLKSFEGDNKMIETERLIGKFSETVKRRSWLGKKIRHIKKAPWNIISPDNTKMI